MAAPGESQAVAAPRDGTRDSGRGAILVSLGILASRIMGLIRQRIFAHYLGTSAPAAAYAAAMRIPNTVQNLLGEGVLSASFIPVYAGLLAEGRRKDAEAVASGVFGLMSVTLLVVVSAGVLGAPLIVDLVTPGFHGETRALTTAYIRIFFPTTGTFALGAWCLGILNSHRRFFLSYASPVAWNAVIIAALLIFGGRCDLPTLGERAAWAALLGALTQLAVQLPATLRLLGGLQPTISLASPEIRQVLRGFGPALLGRGVVQLSAYIDQILSSFLGERAVSVLTYAQLIYLLPVSLFGMAVSAAELPEMSRVQGTTDEVAAKLRGRIEAGLARIAFFVVPSSAAFLFLGDIVGGAILQSGAFTAADTRYLWYLLMGGALGLLASTLGRLYGSTFYAMKDTATPLRFALVRVSLTLVLGYWSSALLPGQLGLPRELGGVGLVATAGIAGWVECLLLRRSLRARIGPVSLPGRRLLALYAIASAAAGIALALKVLLVRTFGANFGAGSAEWGGAFLPAPALHPVITAILLLGPYGVAYFGLTALAGIPESRAVLRRVLRRVVRRP